MDGESPRTNVVGQVPMAPPQNQEDAPAVPITPIMRSVLQLSANITGFSTQCWKGTPGMSAGLLYKEKPYSYTVGFRDCSRGLDINDKGNHLRLRDPVGCHYLTVPVTAQLVWWMHKQGHMDATEPITNVLTELPDFYERITPRDLLTYQVGVEDQAVYKSLGLTMPGGWIPGRATPTEQWENQIWSPLRKKFGQLDGAKPQECRHNVVEYIRKQGDALPRVRKIDNGWKIRPSHFGFCLLAAAIERKMGQSFEDVMRDKIFQPAGTPSAGYGVPTQLIKSGQFFQQTSATSCHNSWYRPSIPPGDIRTAAPSIFNSSLNLFTIPEELGFLICCSVLVTLQALKTFPAPTTFHPFVEWGVRVDPRTNILAMAPSPWSKVDHLPWCGSFHYHTENQAGGFAVGNCGGSRAKAIINATAYINELVFTKQVLEEGVDPEDEENSKECLERLQKQAENNPFKKFFKSDAFTRF